MCEQASAGDETTRERGGRDAAQELALALEISTVLHEPGQRERHRLLLERALELGERELGEVEKTSPSADAVRSTLIHAYAAKARDALHGAGQLSLSAQRAPTREACDEGWQRVETIIVGAETAAQRAAELVAELGAGPRSAETRAVRAARAAVRQAEVAASAARRIAVERNHAYTFHTDGGFSFGEGWYLAAAAVLAGVSIQIEPGKEGTAQAEEFLRVAGLTQQVEPYRSRPRAMKHTTALVGSAFEADPNAAQARLRAAFLGSEPISSELVGWVERRLETAPAATAGKKKVLLWIRDGAHQPGRNTSFGELALLARCVERARLVPVLIGDALRGEPVPEGALDMILFWKEPLFRRADRRRLQLQFFECLRERHGLVGQVGATTAGMDGPALMGLPTLYLTDAPNVRMRRWVGAVPGYEEVVREAGYLEHIERVLSAWAR